MSHVGKVVAVTGASGAMGGEVVSHLLDSKNNYRIRLLIHNPRHSRRFFKKLLKRGHERITLVSGSLREYGDVECLVSSADYVIHCGAAIPPRSDHNPENTFATNFSGTKHIVRAIQNSGRANETKLVYISSVAIYGNRDYHHPWGRVGDPVMPSAYDYYAASKAKAERYVLEAGLPHWVVLRQSAMYHKYFLINNLFDGLMFHTCWNAPLEWVTDSDSGRLIENLVDYDVNGKLDGFWQNIYNIGGGKDCRETGYETFSEGFALMSAGFIGSANLSGSENSNENADINESENLSDGASASKSANGIVEKFFEPHWNIPRNFHGVWFSDSDDLEKWLNYRSETSADYWRRMRKTFWYYKFGALVPSRIIRKLAIERLLTNSNAPMNWIRLNKKGRIDAFWGGKAQFESIPREWKTFPLLAKGKTSEGAIDYADLKDERKAERFRLNHGYDESKSDAELDVNDMREAAYFRGGSVVSNAMKKGDLFTKLRWRCHNGHVFEAAPFTILKGGFWCPECCEPPIWAFDKAAAQIPFYAQVWYGTHDKSEADNVYPYDAHEDDDLIRAEGLIPRRLRRNKGY